MKTSALLLFVSIICFQGLRAQDIPIYQNAAYPVQYRVNDLLKRMTPEEKFWQMFMIPGNPLKQNGRYTEGIFGLQTGALENRDAGEQILRYNPGYSRQEMARQINAIQAFFKDSTRLGIPVIPFEEALHGLVAKGAVVYPQAIGLAATFDETLMQRVARAIADECRLRGIRQVLSPVVNLATDVRWGRTEETYGEDPYLASRMAVAFTSSFENNGIITTPKHFLLNTGDGGRDSYPVFPSERILEELHLRPFRACFQDGGSRSVMTSYNSLDGLPCTAHHGLLNEWLKKEEGFRGFVISDASAVGGANVLHYTARDYATAGAQAVTGGLDVIFQTDYEHHMLYIPPFLDGSLPANVIDSAAGRVLKAKFELGLFENPFVPIPLENNEAEETERKLAREAAVKSVVLLKNHNRTLPLDNRIQTLLVTGPDATPGRTGGYSGPGTHVVSLLEGLHNRTGKSFNILYTPGCSHSGEEWQTVPPEVLYSVQNGISQQGLCAEYFANPDFEGSATLHRTDPEINFRWTLYSPDPAIPFDFFSVRWTGQIQPQEEGEYEIGLEGNDGYRMWIDGKLLIDNSRQTSYGRKTQTFRFQKGKSYDLKIEFRETSGSVWLRMIWKIAGTHPEDEMLKEAERLAAKADAIVVAAGILEGEGLDRARLSLPGRQEELIRMMAASGKPVIVVITGGSAVTMENWKEFADAIVMAWYPGEEGGHALAGILFGDENPAGRLPITFPITEGQLPLVYNHYPTGRNDDYGDFTGQALFPFGYGLSYTEFTYSGLQTLNPDFASGDSCIVCFTLKNTGTRDGEEVVQLYTRSLYMPASMPVKELRRFRRVPLRAGEEKEIRFALHRNEFAVWSPDKGRTCEPGNARIMIGASSRDIRLREEIKLP